MKTPEEVKRELAAGKVLLLAGDAQLLQQLPAGTWVGGTTSSFLSGGTGLSTRERLFVTELPEYIEQVEIKTYNSETISSVYFDAPANGFSFIIIPFRSQTHFAFAMNATKFKAYGLHPLLGWISGQSKEEGAAAMALNGQAASGRTDEAVVMHVKLPEAKVASIGMINPFEQGEADSIRFPASGFSTKDAFINGVRMNFADYLRAQNLDRRLPLVAEHAGVMVNTTFREGTGPDAEVQFYNAVFDFLEYRHARPIDSYADHFTSKIYNGLGVRTLFSCNCILNYLHSELEGRHIDCPPGPTTFGEIAYQTLNQTVVYLRIVDLIARPEA